MTPSSEATARALEARLAEALQEQSATKFWICLTEIMRQASEIDREQAKRADAAQRGLPAVQFLIHHLAKLLSEQPFFQRRQELCAPIFRLEIALHDLNHGRVSPMLKPLDRKKQNGQSAANAMIKGIAARALTELIDGDVPAAEAEQLVAGALRSASRRGLGQVTASTVRNWRYRFKEGKGAAGVTEAGLLAYTEKTPPHMGDTPKARGLYLVAELKRLAANLV